MAKIGARYLVFFPIDTEPEDQMPTYKEKVRMGRLTQIDVSPARVSATIDADDEIAESIDQVVSATISISQAEFEPGTESKVLGSTLTEGNELKDNVDDEAPYGAIAYIQKLRRRGADKYKAVFLPKCKASAPDDSSTTMSSSSPALTAVPLNGQAFPCKNGDWRVRKEFDTAQEAIAYIDTLGGVQA